MALLKQNIESTVFGDLEDRLAMEDIFKRLSSHITDMHRAMTKRAEYIFCLLFTLKQKHGLCPFQISHV